MKSNILIVEDSHTQAKMLKLLLEEQGYGAIVAANGQEGIEAARAHKPDLIISDIAMPVMDGYEMCRRIKTNEELRNIPIILLTVLSDVKDVIRGLNAGAELYVTKPYDPEYLLSKIENLVHLPPRKMQSIPREHLEIIIDDKPYEVVANQHQILNFLISTYENAVEQNKHLIKTQNELKKLNEILENNLEKLQISEEKFKSLVMTIPDIVFWIDPTGRFTFLNKAIKRLGYEPEELIGQHFSKIILSNHIDDVCRAGVLQKHQGIITGDKEAPGLFDERRSGSRRTVGLEIRLHTKRFSGMQPGLQDASGPESIVVEVNSSGMYSQNMARKKMFIGTVGVIRDITDRKQMELALKESEQRLKSLLDHAQTGIVVIDAQNHIIVEANPAAAAMIGVEKADVIGSGCHRFICPVEKGQCPITDLNQDINSSECVLIRPDGTHLPILKTVAPVMLDGRKHLLESFVDISRLKEAEEKLQNAHDVLEIKVEERTAELRDSQAQLILAEKFGALGILTAGIAHELNNPMMGMLNYVQYCLKHTAKDNRIYKVLKDAEHETERCANILRNLLTFSRMGNDEDFAETPFNLIMDRVLSLLAYRMEKENISVKAHIDESASHAWIKVGDIQQVFLNIVGNAMDAVKDAGKKEIRIDIFQDNGFVCAAVADTGKGIEPEIIDKIFDPFFTTKPVGKGTGLGLSVSRSLVESHKGKISCESEVGKGTTFKILLPQKKGEV
ncbi:MAG: PAS domain S-box protein [Desulfobacterales bacterium]|nr:PAS domain S-box protein [Desulfobacterales bacterium]MDD3952030.1 PAS domain S-box protein [Desulfobacterales bacterium]